MVNSLFLILMLTISSAFAENCPNDFLLKVSSCQPLNCQQNLSEEFSILMNKKNEYTNQFSFKKEGDQCVYHIVNNLKGKSSCKIPLSLMSEFTYLNGVFFEKEQLRDLNLWNEILSKKSYNEQKVFFMKNKTELDSNIVLVSMIKEKSQKFFKDNQKFIESLPSLCQDEANNNEKDKSLYLSYFRKMQENNQTNAPAIKNFIHKFAENAKTNTDQFESDCFVKKDMDVCYSLGQLYNEKRIPEKAKKAFEISCDKGKATSCTSLGYMFGKNLNFKDALKFSDKSCQLGDANGCYNAACYSCSLSQKKNALKFIKLSFEKGFKNKNQALIDKDLECIKGEIN